MLGLGNSLTHASPSMGPRSPFSFEKAVLEESDGFYDTSVIGEATFAYNQIAPDSSTGWMKVTFDSTQTDYWSISNSTILDGRGEVGSTTVIEYDIYLNTAALWGDDSANDDDVIRWATQFGSRASSTDVDAETATSISHTLLNNPSDSGVFILRNGLLTEVYDFPLAGAELYIKNLSIDITYS